jgi:hypothetical protein
MKEESENNIIGENLKLPSFMGLKTILRLQARELLQASSKLLLVAYVAQCS